MTKEEIDALRNAFEDCISTEGCGCCSDYDEHVKARKVMETLLANLKPTQPKGSID